MEDIQPKQISTIEKFEFMWLLILATDLFLNYIPSIIYILTFILFVWGSSKIELSFLLIFFPGIMLVDVFDQIINGNTALLILIVAGLLLISKDIIQLKADIFKKMVPLLYILLGFAITYIYAPKGYYSGYKIVAVLINGIAYFLFLAVFIRTNNFNNIRFSLFLLFLFIFFVKMAYIKGVISNPQSIIDFGFIRRNLDDSLNLGIRYTGYHQFGALALFAIIFLLAGTKKLNLLHIFIIITSIYFGFLSGARQMIFGIFVILIVYIIKYFKNNLTIIIPTFIFIFAFSTLSLSEIKIPFISDLLLSNEVYKEAYGRSDLYSEALNIFKENPLLGVGIGGFDPTGSTRDYPHNILLEILAEGGVFMVSIIIVTIYYVKKRSGYKWWDITENGTVFLFLIIGFVIRAVSSSDLIENIVLISALMAIGIYSGMPKYDEIDTTI